jgi:rfaE bifunctional protein kinase chain/domain
VTLDHILNRLPALTIGVLGDLFLDRYLDIDAALTEPSLETGLDAYQVVRVRSCPGAAGTVLNNLVALGVGRIVPIAVIGDDGEGYELQQALARYPAVSREHLLASPARRTPTYTKPMLHQSGQLPRELNRLDIKNRAPLEPESERFVLERLQAVWPGLDALLVLDQVSEADCGVITGGVRRRLGELAASDPGKFVLADSRERIGLFDHVALKPNVRECRQALGADDGDDLGACAAALARRAHRPVFCTLGAEGMLVVDPGTSETWQAPGYSVAGPIDPVGAGDSASAALACAVAAGAPLATAAAFANLTASITIGQLGTTGTASPDQVRQRWEEVSQGEG